MKSIILPPVLIALLLWSLPIRAQLRCTGNQNAGGCPPCKYNDASGPYHLINGRRTVNVFIDGTPSAHVTNSVQAGRTLWNNTTDDLGQRAPYYFENGQAAGRASADVVITLTTDSTVPYAKATTAGTPRQIQVNQNWAATLTQEELAAVVAHEIGHPYGLANAYNQSGYITGCDQSTSVMRGLSNSRPVVRQVQARDVYQMNQAFNNPAQCCAAGNLGDFIDNESGGGGTGGGGGTTSPSSCPAFCPSSTNGPYYTAGPADYCKYPGTGCPFGQFYYGGCCVWNCPILIDVDGDGFDLTDAAGGVYYDPAGDGRYGYTAWPAPGSDDAWLALDRDGNGRIDSFKELFGNITEQPASDDVNGFAALAVYDAAGRGGNGDGQIDGLDAIFRSLRLWQDTNHNGVSEPEELHTLPSLSVSSVSLDYKESGRTDAYGNLFRYRAKVYGPNGQQLGRWAYDVFPVAAP